MSQQPMNYTWIRTPIGTLLIAGDRSGLRTIRFEDGGKAAEPEAGWTRDDRAFRDVCRQLDEWFAGGRKSFEVDLAPEGTKFQKAVWTALRAIPYGEVRSYRQIAEVIGRPSACRAVGAANGANPIPIIIPCHRVIGSNGSLTGFGGGLAAKRWLLELESGSGRLFAGKTFRGD